MFFYYHAWEFAILLPGLLLGLWAQYKLRSAYGRYAEEANERGLTGADVARSILDHNGLQDIEIFEVEGELTDHYDPSKRAVFLSQGNFANASVAAMGVAAHEVGHALQHKEAYALLELRMALVPVTGFATNLFMVFIFAGMFLRGVLGAWAPRLVWIGVALFSVLTLFQLITLPVEYDASARAKRQLSKLGLVSANDADGVATVLSAAALTYVAALVSAALELLRWVLIARDMDRDRR